MVKGIAASLRCSAASLRVLGGFASRVLGGFAEGAGGFASRVLGGFAEGAGASPLGCSALAF